jgi:hypothetical protein
MQPEAQDQVLRLELAPGGNVGCGMPQRARRLDARSRGGGLRARALGRNAWALSVAVSAVARRSRWAITSA